MHYGMAIGASLTTAILAGVAVAVYPPPTVCKVEAAVAKTSSTRIKKDQARLIPFACPTGSREIEGADGDVIACDRKQASK